MASLLRGLGRGRTAGLVGVTALAGLALPAWEILRFQPASRGARADEREIRGAIHVHSDRSDGAAGPAVIARAARQAGLDFLVLTDHRDYQALGYDRYQEGVLLLAGAEISSDGGHIGAIGISAPDFRFDGDPQSVIADISELGGISVACHPFSRHPDRRWRDFSIDDYHALEVVNWAENVEPLSWTVAAGFAASSLNPRYGLLRSLGSIRDGLGLWDELLRIRPMVGLAATDAHGGIRLRPGFFFPFPSYRHTFELWSNHLLLAEGLTGDAARDGARVIEALRAGRLFFALDGLAPADGFRFSAQAEEPALMGDAVELPDRDRPVEIEIQVPNGPAEIVLLKDGEVAERREATRWRHRTSDPGVYRVEVFWRGKSPVAADIPWIVSNPIYVGRRFPERPPEGARSVPPEGVLFEDFEEGPGSWQTWADPSSSVSRASVDRAAGAEGSSASIFFDFRLGEEEKEDERSACALVSAAPAELQRASGLSFFYRASGTFRLDLQVRDENPRDRDRLEPWRASLKTSREWQTVFIPFDRLTSYHPASDGRLNVDQIREIAFYLDTATARPTAAGRIWIDRLRWHP
jgi:hypothetical protein